MSLLENILFAPLFIFATLFFLWNVFRIVSRICLGRWDNRFDNLWSRLVGMFVYGFGQLRVISEKFGYNHFFLFWGFMVLLCINFEFLVAGVFPRFSLGFIGDIPYGILLFLADLMSLVVLGCVVIAFVRRTFFKPEHIDRTADAYFILSLVGGLMVAYFGMHAYEPGVEDKLIWMPVSKFLSDMAGADSHSLARLCWWLHAFILLFFLNYLPYSKHLHVLTAIPACFFRNPQLVGTMPRLTFRKGERFGISKVIQFRWKDLLDFMSCTECGRCQAVCPAHNTQKALNPKEVVHQGKLNIIRNGDAVRASRPADMLASAPDEADMVVPLINGSQESVSKDAIWACTTCGACMQVCPVFIEHAPKIVEMRRHLVMERSDFPSELVTFFENSEQRSNPWGIAPSDRSKWAHELNVPVLSDKVKADYLFYVGCAGAFDSRARQVTVALTKILNAAGLSWGILGNDEKCCGDSLRRLGNEYVFEKMALENINVFKRHSIKKIITYCPHCYTTLKNDYRQYGFDAEVIHHSQLIDSLMKQGKLKGVGGQANGGRVTIHDSCYLGRYNKIYEEPRDIIRACTGSAPIEMERTGEKSFCCGAGGGRMWMEELTGKRIYLERTEEALRQNPSTIAVACPYCLTMFEDGVKDEKAADRTKVKDIAEIVVDSMH